MGTMSLLRHRGWLAGGLAAAALMIGAIGCSALPGTQNTNNPNPNTVLASGLPYGYEGVRGSAYYPPPQGFSQPGITINGVGQVEVRPDLGVLHVGVEAREPTVAQARDAAASAMQAVVDAIRAQGVSADDITTAHFNIRPETVWVETNGPMGRSGEQRIVGYIVSNTATVKVRNIDNVGPVVDAAAVAGGDLIRINSITFTVDDPSPHAARMRELAAADARAKAELYANAMGVQLGPLVSLAETGAVTPMVMEDFAPAMRAAADEAGVPTPISTGNIVLRTNIQATFAIAAQ